ncbi:hypothetical protein [Paenibacillus sinensis]|uniref:hypothetical protein n=1 Tax=Paenibacillus sinensis TaxID=2834413 RepID=UPI001CA87DC7|nr:hypothetical protein [Paenibacillus sinensis]
MKWQRRYALYSYKGLEVRTHNQTCSFELLLQAVNDYLEGTLSQYQIIAEVPVRELHPTGGACHLAILKRRLPGAYQEVKYSSRRGDCPIFAVFSSGYPTVNETYSKVITKELYVGSNSLS